MPVCNLSYPETNTSWYEKYSEYHFHSSVLKLRKASAIHKTLLWLVELYFQRADPEIQDFIRFFLGQVYARYNKHFNKI